MEPVARRLALLVLAVVACGDDAGLPPVLWQGDQLRFRSDESVDGVCSGTLTHLDERARHLDDLFGDPREPVDYVWAPGAALGEYCELPTLGCGREGTAYTVFALDEHELFHALRWPIAQRGLEEGLAVAFGDDRLLAGEVGGGELEAILRATGSHESPEGTDYPRLGHFVSYLVSAYGMDSVVELSRASDLSDDYDALAASFQATLGVSIEQVLDDYERYPTCDSWDYRYDGFDCGRNEVQLPAEDSGELELMVRVACGEPTVLGPRAGEIWTTRTLDVPADGRHLVSVLPNDAATDATLRLQRCGTACDELEALPADGSYWMMLPLCLRRGRYTLRMAVPEGSEATFQVQVRRMDHVACD